MTIQGNLLALQQEIQHTLLQAKRALNSVRLIAVSKTHSVGMVQQAIDAGQKEFGENYLQEALDKIQALPRGVSWHFLGRVQSNKAKLIARHFSWLHTLSRRNVAAQLDKHRLEGLPPLNVCLQVNMDAEASKSGLAPNEIFAFARDLQVFKRLRLRGLMVVPRKRDNYRDQLAVYQQVAELFSRLKQQQPSLDTLSMGMSQDYRAAIHAGSTMVRIGTAIFGERKR